jgi:hypothetical protein
MALQSAWTHASVGRLSPKEQAKLWGLREALKKLNEDEKQYEWMASCVHTVVMPGMPVQNPCRQSVRDFFERVDQDVDGWYPGRAFGAKPGRHADMTPGKRKLIATSMMAAKKRGDTASYELAKARCPVATLNETTGSPFSRRVINDVLTTDCFDETPDKPWEFRFASHRRALTPDDRGNRCGWAGRLLGEGKDATWYRDNIVWIDLSSKVIPGSPAKALDQARCAENKKKRLISRGSAAQSRNAGGSTTADKQCSFGDTRVYFSIFRALTRAIGQTL